MVRPNVFPETAVMKRDTELIAGVVAGVAGLLVFLLIHHLWDNGSPTSTLPNSRPE
jgi:hypothetical protein